MKSQVNKSTREVHWGESCLSLSLREQRFSFHLYASPGAQGKTWCGFLTMEWMKVNGFINHKDTADTFESKWRFVFHRDQWLGVKGMVCMWRRRWGRRERVRWRVEGTPQQLLPVFILPSPLYLGAVPLGATGSARLWSPLLQVGAFFKVMSTCLQVN